MQLDAVAVRDYRRMILLSVNVKSDYLRAGRGREIC